MIDPIILVASAENALASVGCGVLPKKQIITGQDGATYKIRLYPDAEQAKEQEAMLREISSHILMTPILGRHGRGLVFAYPSVDRIDEDDLSAYASIGSFLRDLNQLTCGTVSDQQADQQMDRWLRGIVRAGFVSKDFFQSLQSVYQRLKPGGLKPCIDYLDPMPHNFCRWEGEFCVLDEKHFHIAYPGVGLVKPRLVMSPEKWSAVWRGYQGVPGQDETTWNESFREFYYLVSALHFYAQLMWDGMRDVPENPRLRRYRKRLMELVFDDPWVRNIELVRFWTRFPRESFHAAWLRGTDKAVRLLRRKAEKEGR